MYTSVLLRKSYEIYVNILRFMDCWNSYREALLSFFLQKVKNEIFKTGTELRRKLFSITFRKTKASTRSDAVCDIIN